METNEETPQVSITEVPNAKEAQCDEEVDDEIVQMRKSRPQFDVMRGLSVLGITLQTFREVSSKGDKTRLRSLLNEALFVKTKEADKMQAKDPEDSKRQEELSSAHEAFQYMVKTLIQSDTSPRISASTSSGGAKKKEKVQPLQKTISNASSGSSRRSSFSSNKSKSPTPDPDDDANRLSPLRRQGSSKRSSRGGSRSGSRGSSFSNSGNDEDSRDNSLTPDAAKLMSELNVLLVPPRSPSRTRKLYERRRSSLETNSLVIPTPKTSKPPRLKMKRSKSPDKSLIPGFVPVKMEQSEMPLSPFRGVKTSTLTTSPSGSIKRKERGGSSKRSGRRKSLT